MIKINEWTVKMSKIDLKKFQNKIGYNFKNIDYLKQALRHSSYSNENKMPKISSNERLEFLGDAVLELVTSEYLFANYPDVSEGELTKTRASLVCEPTLNLCAKEIDLGEYLLLGKGEDATGGRTRPSVVSDAMEAVIGAIYLDGGFTNAKEFIIKFILTGIEDKKLFYDSKTILQEIVQGEHYGVISYQLIGETGPDHDKIFTSALFLDDKKIETGSGRTKKAAEQEAAYKTILRLRKNKNGDV